MSGKLNNKMYFCGLLVPLLCTAAGTLLVRYFLFMYDLLIRLERLWWVKSRLLCSADVKYCRAERASC